jgi:hypothetical protein
MVLPDIGVARLRARGRFRSGLHGRHLRVDARLLGAGHHRRWGHAGGFLAAREVGFRFLGHGTVISTKLDVERWALDDGCQTCRWYPSPVLEPRRHERVAGRVYRLAALGALFADVHQLMVQIGMAHERADAVQ